MGILNKLKIKFHAKLKNKYPNSMDVYLTYKSNNPQYFSKHKFSSLIFLNKLISYEKKGKNLKQIKFPKNSHNPPKTSLKNNVTQSNKQAIKESLVNTLLNYDVISFDIFDTCIFRPFKTATDLFSILEKEYKIENFKDIRIKAEIEARAKTNKPNGEIDIFDIYNEITTTLPNCVCTAEKEIMLELELCFANPYMLEIFNILKQHNKTIIAISDMYLPKETILKILNKNGFTNLENLFVSNEYKCNKSNGKLFKIVKKLYKNKKIIHIGDNYLADIIGANKAKIDSYFYQKQIKK